MIDWWRNLFSDKITTWRTDSLIEEFSRFNSKNWAKTEVLSAHSDLQLFFVPQWGHFFLVFTMKSSFETFRNACYSMKIEQLHICSFAVSKLRLPEHCSIVPEKNQRIFEP